MKILKVLLGAALVSMFLMVSPVSAAHVRARAVVIQKGHIHSARCGHYYHRSKWYFVKGHVHRPRCGHAFVGGVWVIR
ncbi:hypothetical protein L0222_29005 [bacterium]|nr:hypothetical protein [bacterium]MCI0606963.1 hypothetical protein [bacterium]